MTAREMALAEGPKWEGARFHRGQRLPYSRGDCICVLWQVYAEHVGQEPWSPYSKFPKEYARLTNGQWEWHTQREFLLEAIAQYMPALHEIPLAAVEPGDWLVTGRAGQPSNHFALVLQDSIVLHATMNPHLKPAGASLMRERLHDGLRKTVRKAFTLETL